MRKDREKAIELRRKGLSYKKIHQELGIPMSTLAGWFKNEMWSIEIRDKLASRESLSYPDKLKRLVAVVREKYNKLHNSYREEAKLDFEKLKNNKLFLAGVMLYWGEGDKKVENTNIRISNSDPTMIKIFYLFLTEIMGVPKEKIFCSLILYPDLNDNPMKNFWSNAIGIPLSQFKKSIYIRGRYPSKRLSYGVCKIRTGSRKNKEKIMVWINLYSHHLQTDLLAEKPKKRIIY